MCKRDQDYSRRKFLKLATCATLLLPVTLIATDRALAQSKAPKSSVQYQDSPKDGQKCGDCQFFTAPDGCQVVEGPISPDGWCSLFSGKK
ncbi:high-potential iron-sulfur protein [Microbulbifer pacificus]|uniref:High-potential iron-sulfur protein n=1 Tax=Microbulbifer pacificus TaxID=407164 RepID=A0AAU0N0P3_9GAMM|nr:high-potential iron-sulfur protein [Microbulbifer pacificus]WOX06356.1 high-potential iron-sulfur protein [Microbulbifer pacificus]